MCRLWLTGLWAAGDQVQLTGICHVAGLGGFSGTYRDGSPDTT
ncbi:hypothetical protein [Pseudotabrizicola sp. 4114]